MACRTAALRQVFFRRTGRHGNRRRTSVREGGAFSVQSDFRLWDISINTETFTTVRYLNAVSPYYSDMYVPKVVLPYCEYVCGKTGSKKAPSTQLSTFFLAGSSLLGLA